MDYYITPIIQASQVLSRVSIVHKNYLQFFYISLPFAAFSFSFLLLNFSSFDSPVTIANETLKTFSVN